MINQYLFPDQQPVMQSPIVEGGPAGTGSGVPQGGGFLSGLSDVTGAFSNLLGGTGGQLLGAGLSLDYLDEARQAAREAMPMFQDIAARGQEAAAFRPFTVSTGFGGVTATPTGGYTTTLSPAMAAQQQALQGITSGLLGGMGGIGGTLQRLGGGTDTVRYETAPGHGSLRPDLTLGPKALELQARLAGQPYVGDVQISPIEMQREDPRLTGGMDFMEFIALPVEERLRIRQEGLDSVALDPSPVAAPQPRATDTMAREELRQSIMPVQPQPQPMAPMAPISPSTGGFGAGIPDVSGIQRQALGGVGGFLTGATAPMAQREADVYERIRATQRPEEQRAQLALEERLAAQGRTGLRTAQFGGSPEQLALAQAQEEAKARASLGALEQAQAEQLQQMNLAESMFGLGGRAAGLPQALQLGQLQNIGLAQAAQYLPEQQLLASLTPAISLADIAGTGQRQGAGYLAQAGTTGLEALGQTELARANLLRDLYSGLLAQQTSAQTGERQESIAGGLFGDLLENIGGIFGIGN